MLENFIRPLAPVIEFLLEVALVRLLNHALLVLVLTHALFCHIGRCNIGLLAFYPELARICLLVQKAKLLRSRFLLVVNHNHIFVELHELVRLYLHLKTNNYSRYN